jgi:hypothetical protein
MNSMLKYTELETIPVATENIDILLEINKNPSTQKNEGVLISMHSIRGYSNNLFKI